MEQSATRLWNFKFLVQMPKVKHELEYWHRGACPAPKHEWSSLQSDCGTSSFWCRCQRSNVSLSIGIVGLPNVGKSTLFNALTDNNILAANYPFATIEPNTGIVPIPDERLNKLSELYGGAPIKPATVQFVDIAGLVAGASKGEGMGNQFLSHIRSTNAIVQVVRAFSDPDVQHVDNKHDPKKDIDVINTELVLA